MTTQKDEAAKVSNESDERATPAARNNAVAKANESNVISYTNADGQSVRIVPSNVSDIDEIVPSGGWDVPQRKRDDIKDIPIMIFEARKMSGNYGDYAIVLCAEIADVDAGNAQPFSIAVQNVPFVKVRRAQGFNEDGREVTGNQLPMKAKLVMRKGDTNEYWDLVSPTWEPGSTVG